MPLPHIPSLRKKRIVTDFERVPPQDINAEQSILGGMMLSPDVIGEVAEVLASGGAFHHPAHQTIYRAILDLYVRSEPTDPITVADCLLKSGDLERIGGRPYLFTLTNSIVTASSAETHAEIVRDHAILRALAEDAVWIREQAYTAQGDAGEIVDAAQARILSISTGRADDSLKLVSDRSEAWLDRIERISQHKGEITGLPTGFTDLDSLTNGLQPGQLVVIAARPGIGKTTLALDIFRSCAIKHGRPAAFFSLEMGEDELMDKLHAAEARVALHHMRNGTVTDEDWARLARRLPDINTAPLYIDDSPELTLMGICTKARRLKQRCELDLIIVDYLQLMQSGNSHRRENRQQEVADMSRKLKLLAKQLQIPVIALSQLNRSSEQRSDKKPMPSDLRESGAIEQDADIVILLHREDAYEKESPRAGEADLIVAKHRNGPTATITVAFQGHYSRFVDMAQT
jgi:replicative DNA helicase